MMRIEILTLFPDFFPSALGASLVGKGIERGRIEVVVSDIREHARGPHRTADDTPYGGGDGMVMKVEPVVAALRAARDRAPGARRIFLSPRGRRFDQSIARELSKAPGLILLCGRYEGVDERALAHVDEELSIGDYVLAGGEAAALVVLEAVTRILPGFVGKAGSIEDESFESGLLEYPHYTRPEVFEGERVPAVLVSGDHGAIARWRRREALRITCARRPDLLEHATLDETDRAILEELRREEE